MCQVSNVSKLARERCPPCRRTNTDPQAGLGAPFLGCAHVEPPLPFSGSTKPPFRTASMPQNTLLVHHKPSTQSPVPTEKAHGCFKTVFFFLPPPTVSCSERIAAFCPFVIFHSWRGEDDRLDVNTGNDIRAKKKKIENKPNYLHENELVIASLFAECEKKPAPLHVNCKHLGKTFRQRRE